MARRSDRPTRGISSQVLNTTRPPGQRGRTRTRHELVAYYVEQHNTVMPHAVFNGLTPDEVYFGKTDGVVESLASQRAAARVERIATNRQLDCPKCPRAPPLEIEGRAA